jgi:hypothetical protein
MLWDVPIIYDDHIYITNKIRFELHHNFRSIYKLEEATRPNPWKITKKKQNSSINLM